MPEAKIAQAVELLDLMLEHFADDCHWTRGCYDDGNGGLCLVGALLHLQPQASSAAGTGDRTPAGCDAPARPCACALQQLLFELSRAAILRVLNPFSLQRGGCKPSVPAGYPGHFRARRLRPASASRRGSSFGR